MTQTERYNENGKLESVDLYETRGDKKIHEEYGYSGSELYEHEIQEIDKDGTCTTLLQEKYDIYGYGGNLDFSFKDGISRDFYNDGTIYREETKNSSTEFYPNGNVKKSEKRLGEITDTKRYTPNGSKVLDSGEFATYLEKNLSNGFGKLSYKFEEQVMQLNEDNILDVIAKFKQKTGKSLIAELKAKSDRIPNNGSEKMINHITQLLYTEYKFDPNFTNDKSVVSHEFYKGDEYSVKCNGFKVQIHNKNTNKTSDLDLDEMLDTMDEEDKIRFASIIQKLPAQVLEDLSVECCDIVYLPKSMNNKIIDFMKKNDFTKGIINKYYLFYGYSKPIRSAGYAYMDESWMCIQQPNDVVITHELGHLIDGDKTTGNKGTFKENPEYQKIFKAEQEAYLKTLKNPRNRMYAAQNEKEFFAEFYEALMSGKTGVLKKYKKNFPQSFDIAMKEYQNKRTKSVQERNKWKDPDNIVYKALSPFRKLHVLAEF